MDPFLGSPRSVRRRLLCFLLFTASVVATTWSLGMVYGIRLLVTGPEGPFFVSMEVSRLYDRCWPAFVVAGLAAAAFLARRFRRLSEGASGPPA